MTVHGGDTWQAAEELGIPATELLDFSANINPRGLPTAARRRLERDSSDPRLLGMYPDRSARHIRSALSEQLAVPPEAIAVGPGAESLFAPILRCLGVQRALVPVPAFSEYRRVCAQHSIEFVPFALDRSAGFRTPVDGLCRRIERESCGLILLNNPHNPSGAMMEPGEIRRIIEAARPSGAAVLLDEAFIDYVPYASMVREAAVTPRLIVVRSLTKFYGCPALRVGYAVAHPDTISRIAAFLPAWPVTQLAMNALAEAVADREYAETSVRQNRSERERLSDGLEPLGLFAFPSAANFLLLELHSNLPVASTLRARLMAKHQILIRNCDSYEGLADGRYARVAVRSETDNLRLIHAIGAEL